jgi:hypothetical protein
VYTELIEILKSVIFMLLIVTSKVLNERRREKRRGKGREKIKKKERSMNLSHKKRIASRP